MIYNPTTGYARGHSNGYDPLTVAVLYYFGRAVGVGKLSPGGKSGRSGVLWVVLTIIPVLGLLVTWYLIYSCIIRLFGPATGDAGIALPLLPGRFYLRLSLISQQRWSRQVWRFQRRTQAAIGTSTQMLPEECARPAPG
jgi:hypothetical protein